MIIPRSGLILRILRAYELHIIYRLPLVIARLWYTKQELVHTTAISLAAYWPQPILMLLLLRFIAHQTSARKNKTQALCSNQKKTTSLFISLRVEK